MTDQQQTTTDDQAEHITPAAAANRLTRRHSDQATAQPARPRREAEPDHEDAPDQAEDQHDQADQDHDDDGTRTSNAEAAKWRRRLREAEAERDQYRQDALSARRQLWGRDYANSLDHQGEAQTIRAHLDELTGTTEAEVQDSAELLLFKYRHDIPRDRSRENLAKALAGHAYSGASAGGALTGHAPSWGDVGQIMRRGDAGD